MDFKAGDKIFDLDGGLGIGEVLDVYINYGDDSEGVPTAVCSFPSEIDPRFPDEPVEPIVCDRPFDQITTDLEHAQTAGPK